MLKKLLLGFILSVTFSFGDVEVAANVCISRIVSTQNGGNFLYFPPNTFGNSNATYRIWGENYDVVRLPSQESFSLALAAKSKGYRVRLIIIDPEQGSWNIDWTRSGSGHVSYIDFDGENSDCQ